MKIRPRTAAIGAALAGGAAAFVYYSYAVEPLDIQVTQMPLTLSRLDPAFDGYRVVQISDIHMDTFMTYGRLIYAIDRVNRLEPDLIAITGDFVSANARYDAAELTAGLSQLRARDGVFSVLGNHDHLSDPNRVRDVLAAARIVELPNAVHTIVRGQAKLHICGVDDWTVGADRLDAVLAALPGEGAAILLAHEPEFANESASTGRFDLQLSGHTHGGQINIPIPGLWTLITAVYADRHRAGWYVKDGMQLYVNRGLGMIVLPLRFNATPEITVLTLLSPPRDDTPEVEG